MGKVSAPEMKGRKRKGRPPKNSLTLKTVNPDSNCRFKRRNPKGFSSLPPELVVDGGDDDDERKEKKVKLVGRLPECGEGKRINQEQQQQKKKKKNKRHSRDEDSDSDSDSGQESEDRKVCSKMRSINEADHGSDGAAAIQEKKVVKGTDTPLHGSPLEFGPTTSLPDRKLLDFILDRLQKKDTYGAFSEPVDLDELPDYFEVIEQPMDFGTIREKLNSGAYKTLEQLEADVILICSNAMQYNGPDTVYYRQARSIQEIAKRDFENLRNEGDNGEPQAKVARRGRPPIIRKQKMLLETSSPMGPEMPSGGTILPTGEDKGIGCNSYNLRKAPAVNRFHTSGIFVPSYRSRNGESYSEWLADWNDEFPASILRADVRYGKKQFVVDETRRETYRKFQHLSSADKSTACCNSIGDVTRLIPVGLHDPHAFAQSLTRFASDIGPVARKVAARKLEAAFPRSLGWLADQSGPQLQSSTEKQKLPNSSAGNWNSACGASQGTADASSYMKTAQLPFYYYKRRNTSPFYSQRSGDEEGKLNMNISPASRVVEKLNKHGEGETNEKGYTFDLNVTGSSTGSTLQIGLPKQQDLPLQLLRY